MSSACAVDIEKARASAKNFPEVLNIFFILKSPFYKIIKKIRLKKQPKNLVRDIVAYKNKNDYKLIA